MEICMPIAIQKFERLNQGQIFDWYGRKFEQQGVNAVTA